MKAMFIGEFSCKVDNKGRLMMPIKFREHLENEEFVITRGLDNCINLFPIERWSEIETGLKELKMTNSKHRAYQRFILSAATKLSLDNQGRLNIPASLMKYSEIDKNAVVTGSNDRIEIWSEEKWENYMNEKLGIIEDIVDEIDF